MLTIQEMKDMLEKALPPKRFKHSLGVYETALKMAEHYGICLLYTSDAADE